MPKETPAIVYVLRRPRAKKPVPEGPALERTFPPPPTRKKALAAYEAERTTPPADWSPLALLGGYLVQYEKARGRKSPGTLLETSVQLQLLVSRVGGAEAWAACQVAVGRELRWVTHSLTRFLADASTYERYVQPLLGKVTRGEQAEWTETRSATPSAKRVYL